MDGQLTQAGERWQLRFTRRLAHSPAKVWQALTEPEHLAVWFPAAIEGARATGAPLRFVFPGAEGPTIEGEMITYQPHSLLEFRWGSDGLRFELEADGDGSVLTFINTFDELGKAARDAAGWHVCLDALAARIDGEIIASGPGERWQTVHSRYVAAFPAEASTIGPPSSATRSA